MSITRKGAVENKYLILGFDFALNERTWRVVVGEEERLRWETDKDTLWVLPWPSVTTLPAKETCGGSCECGK